MDRRGVDGLIMTLAAGQGMVVTSGQMAAAGLTRQMVRTRIGGILTPVTTGVFAVGQLSRDVRLRAALAAVPSAAGSHRTAANAHHLPVAPGDRVEVLADRPTRRMIDGVRFRITRWLPDEDVVVVDGVRLTTVARTICDHAAVVARSRCQHLIEVAITSGLVSAAELQACAASYCRQGRAGSGVLRALEHELLDNEPVPASELERRGVRLLRQGGLPEFVLQYRPPWYDGVRGVVDLAWPELRVLVEFDGRRWHTTTQAQQEDRRRDRIAIMHGWLPLRFAWPEIVHRPRTVLDICQPIVAGRKALLSGPEP